MKSKKFLAAALAAFLVLILAMPVMASAAANASSSLDSADSDPGLLDLIPYSESMGVLINRNEISGIRNVTVKFSTPYDSVTTWSFPYSDDLFSQPENYYSHTFARASLGMAVATFRSSQVNNDNPDDLISYFTSIGFSNVEADAFYHTPTTTSTTYAIASKNIDDKTVIAAVCCGAGYGAEWAGNLTVGNSDRHEGFDSSALIVEDAISQYIEDHDITGELTLWTTGYSRAAAISNIVAADMTDSALFKHVYCYTFATPRTTRDKGNYSNIFNIVGKDDIVPSIPFADWGYERYGTDLYTPSYESNSDFETKVAAANEIMQTLDGHEFLVNPELNSNFRTFFDYLLELIPNAEKYESSLQPSVLQVMENKNNENLLVLAAKVFATFSPEDSAEAEEVSYLVDYIESLANQYVLQGNEEQIKNGHWSADLNLTQNLTTEHNPDKYISWMFSSEDPEYMLSSDTSYIIFTVKGDVDIDVFNDEGFVCIINSDGSVSYDNPYSEASASEEMTPNLYVEKGNGQTNVTIPGDVDYLLILRSDEDQQITYYGSVHTNDSVRSSIEKVYTLNIKADAEYYLYFDEDGAVWVDENNVNAASYDIWSQSVGYSPSVVLKLQHINVFHFTIKEILIFGAVLLIFTYTELIVCITLGIVRIIQRRPRKPVPTIVTHLVNTGLFAGLEISMWYFVPAYPIAKTIPQLICYVFMASLAIVAYSEHKVKRNRFLMLGAILGCVASFLVEFWLPSPITFNIILKLSLYTSVCVAAALTWLGASRRRAIIIADVERARHEKLMAKAEKAMEKAYAKQEAATQRYLKKKKKHS